MALRAHEMQALVLLMRNGSDQIGVIDNEDKLAAACVFEDLKKRGFVLSLKGEGGPTYYLTEQGRRAIANVRI